MSNILGGPCSDFHTSDDTEPYEKVKGNANKVDLLLSTVAELRSCLS